MEEPSFWIELVKTFGLPTVLLVATAVVLYKKDQWIQDKFTSILERSSECIANNTSALNSNTATNTKVLEALEKRQPGSI